MGFQWSSISSTPSLTRQAPLLITRRINYNRLNSSLWEPIPHLKIIHHFLLFFNQAGKFSTSRRKLPDKRWTCFVIGWSGDSGWLDCSFMSLNNDVKETFRQTLCLTPTGMICKQLSYFVLLIIMKWTTVVGKIITTLYFHQLKMVLRVLFLYSVSRKYQFTFPNIN